MRELSQAEITEIISFNLKEIRTREGHSQGLVASRLHICRTAYTKYETGVTLPKLPFLVEFANMYNMTLSEVLSGIDTKMQEE